jgi:N-acetylglucosamine malate deacetylase 1
MDVLLVGAHPDDVEWGIGGIALLLSDHGVSIAIVDMTEGEMGSRGTVEDRRVEASAAAGTIGAEARENLRLPDCGLIDSPENRRAVASAVRRHKPRIVMAPLWQDRHPDHAAAGLLVQNSRVLCGLTTFDDGNEPHRPSAFLYYPLHNFHQPTFVIDTSTVFARKLDLLRSFRSQFVAPAEDFLYRLESRDRYYGSLAGARHGEALVADHPIRPASVAELFHLLR